MSTFVQARDLSTLYVTDCELSYNSATLLNMNTGQCRDSTDTFDIVINTVANGGTGPLLINTAASGANGLDTGTIAANTWYAVFVLFDPTNYLQPAGLLSTSETAPVMPAVNGVTYGAFRLIGWVLTNGSGDLLNFRVVGNANLRKHFWDFGIPVLTAGAATTFTTVNCLAAIPPVNNTEAYCDVAFIPLAAGNTVDFRPTGSTSTTVPRISGVVSSVNQVIPVFILTALSSGNPSFDYINSAAGCSTGVVVLNFQYFI